MTTTSYPVPQSVVITSGNENVQLKVKIEKGGLFPLDIIKKRVIIVV